MTNKKGAPGCGCCGCYEVKADISTFYWKPVNQGSIYERVLNNIYGQVNTYRVTYDATGTAIDSDFLYSEPIDQDWVREQHPDEVHTTTTFRWGFTYEDRQRVTTDEYTDETTATDPEGNEYVATKIRTYTYYYYTYYQYHRGWVTLTKKPVEHIRAFDDKSDQLTDDPDKYQPTCWVGPIPTTGQPELTWFGYVTDFETPDTIEEYNSYVDACENVQGIRSSADGTNIESILPETVDAQQYTVFVNDTTGQGLSGSIPWSNNTYCLTTLHSSAVNAGILRLNYTPYQSNAALVARTLQDPDYAYATKAINQVLDADHKTLATFTLPQGQADHAYVYFEARVEKDNKLNDNTITLDVGKETDGEFVPVAEMLCEDYLVESNDTDPRETRELKYNTSYHRTVGLKDEPIESRAWTVKPFNYYDDGNYDPAWDAVLQPGEALWSGPIDHGTGLYDPIDATVSENQRTLNYGAPQNISHEAGEYIVDRSAVRFEEDQSKLGFSYKVPHPLFLGHYTYQELIDPTVSDGQEPDDGCKLIKQHPATAAPHGLQDWRLDEANTATGSVTAVAGFGQTHQLSMRTPVNGGTNTMEWYSTIDAIAPKVEFQGYDTRSLQFTARYEALGGDPHLDLYAPFSTYAQTGEYSYNSTHGPITVDPDGFYSFRGVVPCGPLPDPILGYGDTPCADRDNACGSTTGTVSSFADRLTYEQYYPIYKEHFLFDCAEFEYTTHDFTGQISIDVEVISNVATDDPDMIEVEATFYIQSYNQGFNETLLTRYVEAGDTYAEHAGRPLLEASGRCTPLFRVLADRGLNGGEDIEIDESWCRFADVMPTSNPDDWISPLDTGDKDFQISKQSIFVYDVSGTPIDDFIGTTVGGGTYTCQRPGYDPQTNPAYWITEVSTALQYEDGFNIAASIKTPGSMGPGSSIDPGPVTLTATLIEDPYYYHVVEFPAGGVFPGGFYPPQYNYVSPIDYYYGNSSQMVTAIYRKLVPKDEWRLDRSHSFTHEDLIGVDEWQTGEFFPGAFMSVPVLRMKADVTDEEWDTIVNSRAFVPTATGVVNRTQEVWAEPSLPLLNHYPEMPALAKPRGGYSFVYHDPDVDTLEDQLEELLWDAQTGLRSIHYLYRVMVYQLVPGAKARNPYYINTGMPSYEVLRGEFWATQYQSGLETVWSGGAWDPSLTIDDTELVHGNIFTSTTISRGVSREDIDREWTLMSQNIFTRYEDPLRQFTHGHKFDINWIKDFTLAIKESGYVPTVGEIPQA